MPLVFVIARDWTLRSAVRAELRERGIDALGMDSADDAGRAVATGQVPAVIVLEGAAEFASNPAIRNLIARIPRIWIVSRTERIPEPTGLPDGQDATRKLTGDILYRPVRVGDIVARVLDFLRASQVA